MGPSLFGDLGGRQGVLYKGASLASCVKTWSSSEFWEEFRMPNGKPFILMSILIWLSQEKEKSPSHTKCLLGAVI